MRRVTNIAITEDAAVMLDHEKGGFAPKPGDLFALSYISSFVNKDGSTVSGFRPGYMAAPVSPKYMGSRWLLVELPNGAEFYFEPRFEWRGDRRYLMDRAKTVYAIFSIEPVTR